MYGIRTSKKAEVLSHWFTLVDNFNISCKEFYSAVERELERRKVPGLKISHEIFSEGGAFSANREYLRMKRERLVFDICAAPFGTSYFFSMRFAELPQGGSLWKVIGWIAGFLVLLRFSILFFGVVMGAILTIILAIILIGVVASFSKETYYRQDTRLMYLEIVNAVVKQRVAEFTSAAGINLLSIRQHSPLMDDLYRTTQLAIEPMESPSLPPPQPALPSV